MSLLETVTQYISNTTSPLSLSLPLAPVVPLTGLIEHLTTQHVHSTYYPYLRFPAIHAARVALIWAGLTRGKKPGSGPAQLAGYLTLAWGGATITSLLLSQPPSWLLSPTPWFIYVPIYTLLVPTGLANFIVGTTPTLVHFLGAFVDGLTRGTTISALPALIASSGKFSGSTAASDSLNGLWTNLLVSGITIGAGGWIVQGLGLTEAEWKISRPAILNGGLLDTLDFWGAGLTTLLYAVLTTSTSLPALNGVRTTLRELLPQEVLLSSNGKSGVGVLVDTAHARAISVIFLGSLLAARVITKFVLDIKKSEEKVKVKKKTEVRLFDDDEKTEVVKSPTKKDKEGKGTPRKSKKAKSP